MRVFDRSLDFCSCLDALNICHCQTNVANINRTEGTPKSNSHDPGWIFLDTDKLSITEAIAMALCSLRDHLNYLTIY